MYKHILVTTEGPISTITMNRPSRRNSLTTEHLLDIQSALKVAGADLTVKGIIIAANGPAFSSGHDFKELVDLDEAAAERLFTLCSEVMQLIPRLPQPVVAQVEGLATAAGCQLVASCDLAVAADTAHFQTPGGMSAFFCTTPGVALARNIGQKRAIEMLLTGDPIDAATALDWGLVNRVVPLTMVPSATRELVTRATRGSASSTAIGKVAAYQQMQMSLDEAYRFASKVMAEEAQTPDGEEAMRAFIEKRRPNFNN